LGDATADYGEARMSEVVRFPKWKENSTPSERLRQVAQWIDDHPGSKNLIIIWENPDGFRECQCESNIRVSEAVYMLEQAKFDMLKEM
jgi:hypothetical protein